MNREIAVSLESSLSHKRRRAAAGSRSRHDAGIRAGVHRLGFCKAARPRHALRCSYPRLPARAAEMHARRARVPSARGAASPALHRCDCAAGGDPERALCRFGSWWSLSTAFGRVSYGVCKAPQMPRCCRSLRGASPSTSIPVAVPAVSPAAVSASTPGCKLEGSHCMMGTAPEPAVGGNAQDARVCIQDAWRLCFQTALRSVYYDGLCIA